MEKYKFILKKYDKIDEILLSPFQTEEVNISIEDIDGVGTIDYEGNETDFSYYDYKKNIEAQGYWGWVDTNNVIHYWIGKKIFLLKNF